MHSFIRNFIVITLLLPTGAYAAGELSGDMTQRKARTAEEHIKAAKVDIKEINGIQLSIGGTSNFQSAFINAETPYTTTSTFNYDDFRFVNETEIDVMATAVSESGLKYGAVIELAASTNDDFRNAYYYPFEASHNSNKTFIWTEGGFGRLEAGATSGVEQTMVVNAASIARATGGIDGDAIDYILPYVADYLYPIIRPEFPLSYVFTNSGINYEYPEYSNKISYYSPNIAGFQLGMSYSPLSSETGTSHGFDYNHLFDTEYDFSDVVSFGINYKKDFDNGLQFGAGMVANYGDHPNSEVLIYENLSAWESGFFVKKDGFSVAASYADWNDSLSNHMIGGGSLDYEGEYKTLGAAYEKGDFGISLTHMHSEIFDSLIKFDSFSVGVDYKLAPGLVPYIEVYKYSEKPNDGYIYGAEKSIMVLIGTYLNF